MTEVYALLLVPVMVVLLFTLVAERLIAAFEVIGELYRQVVPDD